jgi:ferredoxin
MLDRKHAVIDHTDLVEETSRRGQLSDAEVAACNCPDLCIRDHEYE